MHRQLRPQQLLIAATLLGAGCGGPDPVPLRITYKLGTDVLHGCASDSCAAYGMGCGATIGIRIVDPDAEPGTAPLASDCLVYTPPDNSAPTLCNVDDVEPQIQLRDIPTGIAQVQVAIAAPPPFGVPPSCPDEMFRFDLNGIPQVLDPLPAFAGAAYVDVGASPEVEVTLACADFDQVNEAACLPERRIVEVQLDDMTDALVFDSPVASMLSVSVGEPRLVTPPEADPFWVLEPIDADQVDLIAEEAKWEGEREKPGDEPTFETFACIVVAPDGVQTRTVSCAQAPAPDPIDGHFVLSGPYLPDEGIPSREIVAQVLNAATNAGAITDGVPTSGMVVGRVVDHLNQPLGGVVVTPEATGATVRYFTDDGSGFLIGLEPTSATVTNANGYFMSLDLPTGDAPTRWTAQHMVDGRSQVGTYHAGLIANKMSLLLIRMEAP